MITSSLFANKNYFAAVKDVLTLHNTLFYD